MGRPKKYRTEQELEKAVERYFASISYQEPVVVTMATGYTDPSGNAETVRRMLTDGPEGTGCPVTVTKYIEEPSVAALCLYLGISKDTWAEYGKDEKLHPVTERTKVRMEAHLVDQLARGKHVQGVMFNLKNNYGWNERVNVVQENGIEQYLEQLEKQGERHGY